MLLISLAVSDHSFSIAGFATSLRSLPKIPRRKLSRRDRSAPLKLEPGIKGLPKASLITGKSEPIASVERPALMRSAVIVVSFPVISRRFLKVSHIKGLGVIVDIID